MFSQYTLHRLLNKSLNTLSFTDPTAVQDAVIPLAMDGIDLKISAPTGTGKTVAYLLPLLHRLLTQTNPDNDSSRALILLPTRELALQVFEHCQSLAQYTNLKSALIVGGEAIETQSLVFEDNPHIVIATVGRLLHHLDKGLPDFYGLDILVVDEADQMLAMDCYDEALKIIKHCNPDRQTLLVSATLDGLNDSAQEILKEPETIKIEGQARSLDNIKQQVILSDNTAHKQEIACKLLRFETYKKAIVFTNSKNKADRLGSFLMHKRLRVGILHGDLDQERRLRVMELLREGKLNILIASDLASRGLDIVGVDMVINFDMPVRGDVYQHRIGRTGRANSDGLAISLIGAKDWNLMIRIQRYMEMSFERRKVPGLEGSYTGPARVKANGKAAGSNKKKLKTTAGERAKKRKLKLKKINKKAKRLAASE